MWVASANVRTLSGWIGELMRNSANDLFTISYIFGDKIIVHKRSLPLPLRQTVDTRFALALKHGGYLTFTKGIAFDLVRIRYSADFSFTEQLHFLRGGQVFV